MRLDPLFKVSSTKSQGALGGCPRQHSGTWHWEVVSSSVTFAFSTPFPPFNQSSLYYSIDIPTIASSKKCFATKTTKCFSSKFLLRFSDSMEPGWHHQ